MNPVELLIERFGGPAALAKAGDVEPNTVTGWRKRGFVPARRQPIIFREARKQGIQLTAEELIGIDSAVTADSFLPSSEGEK